MWKKQIWKGKWSSKKKAEEQAAIDACNLIIKQ
jgi:dsRNA-specific ribonuclease